MTLIYIRYKLYISQSKNIPEVRGFADTYV